MVYYVTQNRYLLHILGFFCCCPSYIFSLQLVLTTILYTLHFFVIGVIMLQFKQLK